MGRFGQAMSWSRKVCCGGRGEGGGAFCCGLDRGQSRGCFLGGGEGKGTYSWVGQGLKHGVLGKEERARCFAVGWTGTETGVVSLDEGKSKSFCCRGAGTETWCFAGKRGSAGGFCWWVPTEP